ncbi:dTDP-4-dehydrorhamnose reductase [Lacticaseibacillus suihuaensis]
MKVLITGANGQLGSELCRLLDNRGLAYRGTASNELDITDAQAVETYVANFRPDVIYHCAAYTSVDEAEGEGKSDNQRVNVDGTRNLAKAAEAVGATIVYISTDYVFDGERKDVYSVNDKPAPKNEYGRAKYEGEQEIRQFATKYYIIRTSWVFGRFGHNFVYTMLNLAKTHNRLTVVNDQFGRPTWTKTLAEFMTYAIDQNLEFGTYHLSNEGSCTWYEFAREILKNNDDVDVVPVSSSEYPQKAYRPRHSVLDLRETEKTGFEIPTWREALHQFMNEADLTK